MTPDEKFRIWHYEFEDRSIICSWGGCPDCDGRKFVREIEDWLARRDYEKERLGRR